MDRKTEDYLPSLLANYTSNIFLKKNSEISKKFALFSQTEILKFLFLEKEEKSHIQIGDQLLTPDHAIFKLVLKAKQVIIIF